MIKTAQRSEKSDLAISQLIIHERNVDLFVIGSTSVGHAMFAIATSIIFLISRLYFLGLARLANAISVDTINRSRGFKILVIPGSLKRFIDSDGGNGTGHVVTWSRGHGSAETYNKTNQA